MRTSRNARSSGLRLSQRTELDRVAMLRAEYRDVGEAGVLAVAPGDLLVATSAHAPHADGSVRPKLGVLAERPEAASTGAVTTAPRPALPQQACSSHARPGTARSAQTRLRVRTRISPSRSRALLSAACRALRPRRQPSRRRLLSASGANAAGLGASILTVCYSVSEVPATGRFAVASMSRGRPTGARSAGRSPREACSRPRGQGLASRPRGDRRVSGRRASGRRLRGASRRS